MPLIIHHLQVSQSERLPWLCEELAIPYTLVLHQRAPFLSPPSIKDLNPLGQAPIIQDGALTLFESAACAEYISQIHGSGQLILPPAHANYPDYLYWFHFANSNLQPLVSTNMQLFRNNITGAYAEGLRARLDAALGMLNARLSANAWLAGDELTLADVMIVFTLTTMRSFYAYDLTAFEGILGYLKRIVGREGYRKSRAKADPGLELMIEGKPPTSFMEKLKSAGKI